MTEGQISRGRSFLAKGVNYDSKFLYSMRTYNQKQSISRTTTTSEIIKEEKLMDMI